MRLRLIMMMVLGSCLWLAPGCKRLPDGELVAEASEPGYEEGKRLLRQGKEQAALASFMKVIESRRDGAPESHLEVGLLYQLEIKDPIAAIYHFRRYLELNPNSPQSDLVNQRIDAATREFARTLPAQPLENQALRNDLLDVVDRLQRENTRLKDEVAVLRNNAGSPRGAVADLGGNPSNPGTSRVIVPAGGSASPITSVPLTDTDARMESRPTRPDATPAAPASAVRKHVVVKGDTLYNLARHYYNNSARAKDIYAANKDKMKSDADLQIGMELTIPQ